PHCPSAGGVFPRPPQEFFLCAGDSLRHGADANLAAGRAAGRYRAPMAVLPGAVFHRRCDFADRGELRVSEFSAGVFGASGGGALPRLWGVSGGGAGGALARWVAVARPGRVVFFLRRRSTSSTL